MSDFERFARDSALGAMASLRGMGGATFTESDRRAMADGLDVIRVALVQPVGLCASQSDFEEPGDSVQSRVVDLVRRCRALAERERGE